MTPQPTRDQHIRAQRAAERPARGRTPRPSPTVLGATPIARARAIGNALLERLARVDPAAAAEMRAQAHVFGETWLGAELGETSSRLTRTEFAALAGVRPQTVSTWVERQLIEQGPDGLYDERDVEDFLRNRPTTRKVSTS